VREPPATRDRNNVVVTGVVALAARLVVSALAWNRFPPADDGVYYDKLARRLALGLGYTWAWPDGVVTPVAHYPVGYPALLGIAYRFLGDQPRSALLLHALVGSVGAICVHLVASQGTPRNAARAAGLVAALHPALLSYTPAIMTEGVTSALLALPFALAVLARRAKQSAPATMLRGLAGMTLGAVALVRPQALLVAPVVAWLSSKEGWGRRISAGSLVLLGAASVLAPWTARNERVFGRPIAVSANGGWNLLIGTDAAANGTWRALEVPAECREVWDEAAKDVCFGQAARARILAAPIAWIELAPAKLAATFDLGGSGLSYLSRARPDLVPRWAVLAMGAVETLFERATLLTALLSLGFEKATHDRSRRAVAVASSLFLLTPHAWPAYLGLAVVLSLQGRARLSSEPLLGATWAILVATLLTHAVFFGAARYALLVYPWIAATAAAAWSARPSPLARTSTSDGSGRHPAG